ncbi:hypothetical protein WA026_006740 [Henosepilachna vigintioctopunctata]|uniref:Uncharacterized protein n=1 Tax=Henosepilachna vigintioctopunctata TaxID=420089 RepID=A0AAW1U9R7_9CUCU
MKQAYEYATINSKKVPDSRTSKNCAGKDLFRGFMKRNPELSLRTPKATTLYRSTSFNRKNVAYLFLRKPQGQVTSPERGSLVTGCCASKEKAVKRQVLQSSDSETNPEDKPKYDDSSDSPWNEEPDVIDNW